MIPRLSSAEFMNILENANMDMDIIKSKSQEIEKEVNRKLKLIKNHQELQDSKITEIETLINNNLLKVNSNSSLLYKDAIGGDFTKFNKSIHPKFHKDPTQIFNFYTKFGPAFKDNMTVYINGNEMPNFKSVLMEDNVKEKELSFMEFDSPDVTFEVVIKPDMLLGVTAFNIIEFMPEFQSAYSLVGMDIFTLHDYRTNNDLVPSYIFTSPIENMLNYRLFLDKTYELYRIKFHFRINFQNSNGKYPFAFKHIYFYNANINLKSYAVYEINSDKLIESISEDIIINDQYGKRKTTCTKEKIEIYMDYRDGEFVHQVPTSKGLTQNVIPRNIKKLFVKLPVNHSMTSIKFKNISTRI